MSSYRFRLEKTEGQPHNRSDKGPPETLVYVGHYYGKKVLDFKVTVKYHCNLADGKFRVKSIEFGEDMQGESVEEVLKMLTSRMERALEVMSKMKTDRSIPVSFDMEE